MENPISILPAYLNIPGEQIEYPNTKKKSSDWPNVWINANMPLDEFYKLDAGVIIFEAAEDTVDEILRRGDRNRTIFDGETTKR